MTKAWITRTPRDRDRNAGIIEPYGARDTVEEAKGYAEKIGAFHYPGGDFHWRQFSDTTWGLMNGIAYTFILVSVTP